MRLEYLGDTYDLAKRFLMKCIAPDGPWGIVPMFTDDWDVDCIRRFERLLGAKVRLSDVILPDTDRKSYFREALEVGYNFIDPDIGVSIERRKPSDWPKFISVAELSDLVLRNPDHLTLVYDQSYSRQSHLISPRMLRKLALLDELGVIGFGYLGQASFLVLSCNPEAIRQARHNLLAAGVPDSRLVH